MCLKLHTLAVAGVMASACVMAIVAVVPAADEPLPDAPGIAASNPVTQDYQSLTGADPPAAGPLGNLDAAARHFGILKAVDPQRERVSLLIDGEAEPLEYAFRPGAEVWRHGWWGRLDEFIAGDRLWVWLEKDPANHAVRVALLADELSEQGLYAPLRVKAVNMAVPEGGSVTLESVRVKKATERTINLTNAELYRGDAQAPHDSLEAGETVYVQTTGDVARLILDPQAFQQRQAAQQALLRQRWADEGLPATLIFLHSERHEVELMLDHEAMRWARSLQPEDKVTLCAAQPVPAVVRQVQPWRERTQVLLGVGGSDLSAWTVGLRVRLRLAVPPTEAIDDDLPAGLDVARSKSQRVEWLMANIYCTCLMNDVCAGHMFTLAACDSGAGHTCGLAKNTRASIAEMIDKGDTDQQVFQQLLKERGPNLLRPHMLP